MKPIVTLAVVLSLGALAAGGSYVAPELFRAGPAVISANCPYQDPSGGFGGQAGSCAWTCEKGIAELEVKVNDGDAKTSGRGACSGKTILSCSGKGGCGDDATVTAAGAGACEGESSEFYDSGIEISCGMKSVDGELPPDTDEFCPVAVRPSPPYPRVCVDPVPSALRSFCQASEHGCEFIIDSCGISYTWECAAEDQSASSMSSTQIQAPLHPCLITYGTEGQRLCTMAMSKEGRQRVLENITRYVFTTFETDNHTSALKLYVWEGYSIGLQCKGYDCVQRVVNCDPIGEGANVRCALK